MKKKGKFSLIKTGIILFIIWLFIYLIKAFPDELILFIGCGAIIIIGVWLWQIEQD